MTSVQPVTAASFVHKRWVEWCLPSPITLERKALLTTLLRLCLIVYLVFFGVWSLWTERTWWKFFAFLTNNSWIVVFLYVFFAFCLSASLCRRKIVRRTSDLESDGTDQQLTGATVEKPAFLVRLCQVLLQMGVVLQFCVTALYWTLVFPDLARNNKIRYPVLSVNLHGGSLMLMLLELAETGVSFRPFDAIFTLIFCAIYTPMNWFATVHTGHPVYAVVTWQDWKTPALLAFGYSLIIAVHFVFVALTNRRGQTRAPASLEDPLVEGASPGRKGSQQGNIVAPAVEPAGR